MRRSGGSQMERRVLLHQFMGSHVADVGGHGEPGSFTENVAVRIFPVDELPLCQEKRLDSLPYKVQRVPDTRGLT